MGCLKLHTENNYITLKVVYSAVNTSVLEKQGEKNNTTFLEVVYNVAQGGGGDALPTMPNNYKEGVEGSSVAFSVTEKAAELSFGKTNGIYKTFKVLGKVTGAISVYNDAANIVNKILDPNKSPTWRDWGKLGTSSLFLGSSSINPFIPVGYFLLEISGHNPWEMGSSPTPINR